MVSMPPRSVSRRPTMWGSLSCTRSTSAAYGTRRGAVGPPEGARSLRRSCHPDLRSPSIGSCRGSRPNGTSTRPARAGRSSTAACASSTSPGSRRCPSGSRCAVASAWRSSPTSSTGCSGGCSTSPSSEAARCSSSAATRLLLLFVGDDHPQQAAAAAVEMRAALRTAIEEPLSVGRVQLRMSVGLHSGTVQLFRVGTLHQELIVTGPAATRTTEMEHAASAGQIFVSPEMALRLPRQATKPGPPGTMVLRWRQAPVAPTGPRARRPLPAETVDACLPAILREHLRPGEVEFEHRIAAVAFIRYRGVDSLLETEGPDAVADALHAVVSTVQEAADDAGRRVPGQRHRRGRRQDHPRQRGAAGPGRPRGAAAPSAALDRRHGSPAAAADRRQRRPRVRRHDRRHPSRDLHRHGRHGEPRRAPDERRAGGRGLRHRRRARPVAADLRHARPSSRSRSRARRSRSRPTPWTTRSAGARRPHQEGPFVGRRDELQAVTEVLQRSRAGPEGRPDHRRGHRHGEEPPGDGGARRRRGLQLLHGAGRAGWHHELLPRVP